MRTGHSLEPDPAQDIGLVVAALCLMVALVSLLAAQPDVAAAAAVEFVILAGVRPMASVLVPDCQSDQAGQTRPVVAAPYPSIFGLVLAGPLVF